jgi:hypothetical protein
MQVECKLENETRQLAYILNNFFYEKTLLFSGYKDGS